MDHILKRGEDLASKEILRLIKQIKQQEKQSVPKKFPGTPPPHKSAPPSPPHHSNGASKRKDSSSSSSRSSTPAKVNKSSKSGVCLLLWYEALLHCLWRRRRWSYIPRSCRFFVSSWSCLVCLTHLRFIYVSYSPPTALLHVTLIDLRHIPLFLQFSNIVNCTYAIMT